MNSLTEIQESLFDSYRRASRRQLWLDYDGSLVPFADRPEEAAPSSSVIEVLQQLTMDDRNQLIVISGRDAVTMERWLGKLRLNLVAEHGAFLRQVEKPWEPYLTGSAGWKPTLKSYMYTLVSQHPGSFVEEKQFSLVWHYREIADQIWPEELTQINEAVQSLVLQHGALLYREACAFEVRSRGIDKGLFFRQNPWKDVAVEFGLVLGDGHTDEDMFRQAPTDFYTIKVESAEISAARYQLAYQAEVLPLLKALAETSPVPSLRTS
jgi:trehalose 6-phosphate synthase/phosphatase